MDDYLCEIVESAGFNMRKETELNVKDSLKYLTYIYSTQFDDFLTQKCSGIYNNIFGMFTATHLERIKSAEYAFRELDSIYKEIQGISDGAKKCILGDTQKTTNGTIVYSKHFSQMYEHLYQINDFFMNLDYLGLNTSHPDYLGFSQDLYYFCQSLKYIESNSKRICGDAVCSLQSLRKSLSSEMFKTKIKYFFRRSNVTYRSTLNRCNTTIADIDKALVWLQTYSYYLERFTCLMDLKGMSSVMSLFSSKDTKTIVENIFKAIINPVKERYNILKDTISQQDIYCMALLLTKFEFGLSPRYRYILIDEAQDISEPEMRILKYVNTNADFNLFGDLQQNITPYKGITDWNSLGLEVFKSNINYRNTMEIASFVTTMLDVNMRAVGESGAPVRAVVPSKVYAFLADKNGSRAIICSPDKITELADARYNTVSETGLVSKGQINLMTVYESKGLEFSAVVVFDAGLSKKERYVAYTRALDNLAIVR